MSTETIYARVPTSLKLAVDDHAAAKGSTLTGAVVDLLERGLEAVGNQATLAALEERVLHLQSDLAGTQAELQVATARRDAMSGAYAMLGTRLAHQLGKCPECKGAITGHDVFVEGRCPACEHGLTSLLIPQQAGAALDRTETLLLVGAVGVLLAMALLASRTA